MKKIIFMLTVGLLLLFLIAACSYDTNETETNETDTANETPPVTNEDETDEAVEDNATMNASDVQSISPSWQTITATEALSIMAESDNYVLLDVRTAAEFQERHIEGAILIPYDEIRSRAQAELLDKNAVILIYCRSGRRSASAAADLVLLGFTNVYDFGGILDWPYDTVSE